MAKERRNDERIAKIEQKAEDLEKTVMLRFDNVEGQLEHIITNHLPHLQASVDTIKDKVSDMDKRVLIWGFVIFLMVLVGRFVDLPQLIKLLMAVF